MSVRTRSELLDFLCLVFAIGPASSGPFRTAADFVAVTGIEATTMARITRAGLTGRTGLGDPGAPFGRDEARTVALAARLVELGADDDDLSALTDALDGHCALCPAGSPCPRPCDTLDELRALLLRLQSEARTSGEGSAHRVPVLGRAIRSIEELGDLI